VTWRKLPPVALDLPDKALAGLVALANADGECAEAGVLIRPDARRPEDDRAVAGDHRHADAHSVSIKATEGLIVTDTFYWDTNDETSAFSKRFKNVGHADHAPGRPVRA